MCRRKISWTCLSNREVRGNWGRAKEGGVTVTGLSTCLLSCENIYVCLGGSMYNTIAYV